MGYQDKGSTTTVFAKLTKHGMQQILNNDGSFNVAYFAPCDDEVDYRLWNPTHPDGTDYYGAQIEALPILEPNSSHLYQVNSKLILNYDADAERFPAFTTNLETVHFTKEKASETEMIRVRYQNHGGEPFQITNVNRRKFNVTCTGGVNPGINSDPANTKRRTKTAYWSEVYNCPAGADIHIEVGQVKGGDANTFAKGYGASTLVKIEGLNSGFKYNLPVTADGNTGDQDLG